MTGGVLYGDDVMVSGVSIDTRTIKQDELFIAIRGENFDGHDFAPQTAVSGVAALMVSRRLDIDLAQILVKDTLRALHDLAVGWRKRINPTMIAITGSNGKTTTREMAFSMLQRCKKAFASCKNYNNDIGVSLSLLGIRASHEVAVIELGANHAGEIRALSERVQVDIGVVTNAGAAHLEGFGSLSGVASAKGELFDTLAPRSTAVLNVDDVYFDYWRGVLEAHDNPCRMITFGIKHPADVQGKQLKDKFEITIAGQTRTFSLLLPGQHNLYNALAAAAAVYSAGVDIDTIVAGLETMTPMSGRLTKITGASGVCLFDDTYNANPPSLIAALEVLASHSGEKWLVLGDMAELGVDSKQSHIRAGLSAKASGIKHLFTVGDLTYHASAAFGSGAEHFATIDLLLAELSARVNADVVLLVKGSRVAGMEKVIEGLR